jgi:hypothetical protein
LRRWCTYEPLCCHACPCARQRVSLYPLVFQTHVARNTDQLLLSCFTMAIIRLSGHCLLAFFRRWRWTWTTRREQWERVEIRRQGG